MNLVAKLDRTRIGPRREFRMATIEAVEVMALRAPLVTGARQPKSALMLDVAIHACRIKGLLHVVNGSVMALGTCLVRHLSPELRFDGVTGSTFIRENRVGMRQGAGVEGLPPAPCQPQERQRREADREDPAHSRDRIQPLEIVEVDPLGKLLGGPGAPRHAQ